MSEPEERYDEVARLLQELRAEHQLSWKQLALRLEALGHPIDDTVLANRINRGAISAGFALLNAGSDWDVEVVLPEGSLETQGGPID